MVWWLKKRQLVHPSAGCVCNEFCLVLVRCTRRGLCIFFCISIGLNTEIYDIWSVYYKKIINTVVFLSHIDNIRQKQRYHAVIKPFNTECQRLSSFFFYITR